MKFLASKVIKKNKIKMTQEKMLKIEKHRGREGEDRAQVVTIVLLLP